jgi:putative oxidoreductase
MIDQEEAMALQNSVAPYFRSLLRIVAGFGLACHGVQKLLAIQRGTHLPPLLVAAALLETAGGFLMFIGLFSSPVAFILCGEMAVAYFKAHFPRGFLPIKNGGEPAMLYCLIFLYLFAAGGGPLSVDRLIRRK